MGKLWVPGMADGEGFFERAGYPALNTFSYLAGLTMALAAPGRREWRRVWLSLTLSFYWPLQSLAMIRAFYGLAKCPNFWAKTPHTVLA